MYSIKHIKGPQQNTIEISGLRNKYFAKIHLNEGGSLQQLILDDKCVIKNLYPLSYRNTYASSILFPFANRVADGTYKFNGESHNLEINQKQEKNALHGLVYNKSFKVAKQTATSDKASILLQFEEITKSKGSPYTYKIELEYALTNDSLNLKVFITNTDSKTFPFTLGWHPYFNSSDLKRSDLNFKSCKKAEFNSRNITMHLKDFILNGKLKLGSQSWDDCFVLDSNQVIFNSPNYSFKLTSSEDGGFLQIYTPPLPNIIAIEPTTGISNSFNNRIGLKTLKPKETYTINWNLKIIQETK